MKCFYYNKGHCRHKNSCRNEPPKRTCHEQKCDWKACGKRHPKPCRNFFLNRFCYFGSKCSFSHVYDCEGCENLKYIIEKDDKVADSIQDLETKLKEMEDKNSDLKNEIAEVRKENDSLKVENVNKQTNSAQLDQMKIAMRTVEDQHLEINEAKFNDLKKLNKKIIH